MGLEALGIFRASGVHFDLSTTLGFLAHVDLARGNVPQAIQRLSESLTIARAIDHRWLIASDIVGFAATAAAQGQPELAARLLGAADALLTATGQPKPSNYFDQAQTQSTVREALGEAAFTQAWAEGQGLLMAEVLTLIETMTPEA
jgi:hypothetical protein